MSIALKQKYGDYSKHNDECNALELECQQFWALKTKEGVTDYNYIWKFADGARSDKISVFMIDAAADNSINTRAALVYKSNDPRCAAAANASL